MNTLLYHVDVFMPPQLSQPLHQGPLRYGYHARQEALADRYGKVPLPSALSTEKAKLVEVEVDSGGQVVKQVWRMPLDSKRDVVLAVTKGGFVKTVWVNLATDAHRTLDKSRYVKRYSKVKFVH